MLALAGAAGYLDDAAARAATATGLARSPGPDIAVPDIAVPDIAVPVTGAVTSPGPVTAWASSVHAAFERQARHAVAAARAAFTQSGVASWYGYEFAGRRTSSGVRFNPLLLTCAHRTQPLGSRLLVTSEATGRSVVVTVTDRGPYAGGDRIIDLSRAAATRIGIIHDGLNHVTIERVGPAGSPPGGPPGSPLGSDVEVAQADSRDSSDQAVRASR